MNRDEGQDGEGRGGVGGTVATSITKALLQLHIHLAEGEERLELKTV